MKVGKQKRYLPNQPPQQNSRRALARALILIGGGLVLAGVLSALALWFWNAPLGPKLTINQTPQVRVAPPAIPEDASTTEPGQWNTGDPLCGGPPSMLILGIGIDTETETFNRSFADVIRLVRVDFVHPSAVMVPVPRDLWVPIPGLKETGVAENRLSTTYTYGTRYRGPGGGPMLLAETLAEQFGFIPDYYVVLDFTAFATGVDAIGGVDVHLTEPIDATGEGLSVLPAGWNHLDGKAALAYARARPDNSSDLARIERQTDLIRAIQQKVMSPQVLPSAPRLMRSIQDSMLTDLSPAEVSMLLCLAQELAPEDIQVANMDGTMYTSITDEYGYQRLLPDREAITTFLQAFQAGELQTMPMPKEGLPPS